MYAGEFDGAAAFSGAGFMPSQASPAPDSSYSLSKNRNVKTLLPLTVKQINDMSSSDESGTSSDGVDVNTVTIVGMVRDMQDKEPQFIFLVDDGTGQIECSRWAHERMEFNEVNPISQGMYVRVYGHLKTILDKRSLNAYSIRPVTDFNEITGHFVECIYVQMYNSRLQAGTSTQPQMTNSTTAAAVTTTTTNNNTPSKEEYQAAPSNQYNFDGKRNINPMVLKLLQQPECLASNKGIHRDEMARQLNIPEDKLREALDFLFESGLVYTEDDHHYKSIVNA